MKLNKQTIKQYQLRRAKIRKNILLAVLTSVSLVLFIIEAQMPPLIAVPGFKIGLANIVTLFVLFRKDFTVIDAILLVTARVTLGALATGMSSFIYSFSGGMAALGVMFLFRKLFARKMIPVVSVAGALAHNIVQVAVASFLTTAAVFLYLPLLILCGIATGLLTGFTVMLILKVDFNKNNF